jgi:hypothetical protein
MKIEDLRVAIRVRQAAPQPAEQRRSGSVHRALAHAWRCGGAQDACGIMPGIQKLSYAGKNFDDASRTLEQCAPHHHHPHAALRSLGGNPSARHAVSRARPCPRGAQLRRALLARQVPALAAHHPPPLRQRSTALAEPRTRAAAPAKSSCVQQPQQQPHAPARPQARFCRTCHLTAPLRVVA